MKLLTSPALRSAPLINTADDTVYHLQFPVPYVPHVIEFCSPTLTGAWGSGNTIEVGYLGVDNYTRYNDGAGSYTNVFTTFVPALNAAGEPLVITKNMQVPVAPSKSGVLVLKVNGTLTNVHIAVAPINEGRQEQVLYLPKI